MRDGRPCICELVDGDNRPTSLGSGATLHHRRPTTCNVQIYLEIYYLVKSAGTRYPFPHGYGPPRSPTIVGTNARIRTDRVDRTDRGDRTIVWTVRIVGIPTMVGTYVTRISTVPTIVGDRTSVSPRIRSPTVPYDRRGPDIRFPTDTSPRGPSKRGDWTSVSPQIRPPRVRPPTIVGIGHPFPHGYCPLRS